MTRLSGICVYGTGVAVSAGLIIGMAFVGAAHAQKAPQSDAAKASQSAWVKLCDKVTLQKPNKEGKMEKVTNDICLTLHERLDGNSGRVVVSAAIREVKGDDKPELMLMVPPDTLINPGMKVAVYNKDQWARLQKKEQVKDNELKPLSLKYASCNLGGCAAEIDATKELIDTMSKGGGMMVLSVTSVGRVIGFEIPLTGFDQAYKGAPVDNEKYTKARESVMLRIRERMRERIAKQATGGLLPEPQQVKK